MLPRSIRMGKRVGVRVSAQVTMQTGGHVWLLCGSQKAGWQASWQAGQPAGLGWSAGLVGSLALWPGGRLAGSCRAPRLACLRGCAARTSGRLRVSRVAGAPTRNRLRARRHAPGTGAHCFGERDNVRSLAWPRGQSKAGYEAAAKSRKPRLLLLLARKRLPDALQAGCGLFSRARES